MALQMVGSIYYCNCFTAASPCITIDQSCPESVQTRPTEFYPSGIGDCEILSQFVKA